MATKLSPKNTELIPSFSGALLKRCSTLNRTLNLNSFGVYITNQRDRSLWEYSLSVLPNLVFLNKSRSATISAMRVLGAMDDKAILYPAALASAASHLFARGAITNLEFYEKRQIALRNLRAAIAAPKQDAFKARTSFDPGQQECIPTRCCDHTIEASLRLAAIELMQGAGFRCIYPFLCGTASLVGERHEYAEHLHPKHRGLANLNSPYFILTKRMLAYFDVLSCVPCARRPLLDEKYWLTDEWCVREENIDGSGLDPVMGCFATVIGLTGKSAALVCMHFEGRIGTDYFRSNHRTLLRRLANWKPLLPESSLSTERASEAKYSCRTPDSGPISEKYQEYTLCVSAGNAHSIATQIFLHRATNFDQYSHVIQSLVCSLRAAVVEVGVESTPTTTMLWPLWVLACECYDTGTRNQTVVPFFSELLERQGFLNIAQCFDILQERIWKLRSVPDPTSLKHDISETHNFKTDGTIECDEPGNSWQQSQWVLFCWAEKIELILA